MSRSSRSLYRLCLKAKRWELRGEGQGNHIEVVFYLGVGVLDGGGGGDRQGQQRGGGCALPHSQRLCV